MSHCFTCFVPTLSVMEVRGFLGHCVLDWPTRPPDLLVSETRFTAVLFKLRSATFHGPSLQGVLPKLALQRAGQCCHNKRLRVLASCWAFLNQPVLLPSCQDIWRNCRSKPPKWNLKSWESGGKFHLSLHHSATPYCLNLESSLRKYWLHWCISDSPKLRLRFWCDYYGVITVYSACACIKAAQMHTYMQSATSCDRVCNAIQKVH